MPIRSALRLLPIALLAAPPLATAAEPVDFNKQIRPVFAEQCIRCHGPEKQRGDLRLDQKAAALGESLSGKVILPGNSAESLLVQHLLGADDLRRMPPEPADPLPPDTIDLIRRWIDAGAPWPDETDAAEQDPRANHWAFRKPERPEPPAVSRPEWCRSPIDNFVLARLEKEGLAPSPEADRETLIRRVSLDLTGLPPTIEEIDAFLADTSPDAYEKLVDRLLASPHYGEARAREWLDAARYADTNGYEKDRPRSMWRYRDYVIDAYNRDLPFDRFTIEQMAGDLLAAAAGDTIDEAEATRLRIATGFHRNTMINEEGGIDTEEYRYHSIVDRVATTSTVWLGMTVACAQCHNHKYDPITQRDYYRFFAILNNQDEPILETPTAEQIAARERIEKQIAELEATYADAFPLPYDELTWTVLDPAELQAAGGTTLTKRDDLSILAGGQSPDADTYTVTTLTDARDIVAVRLEVLTDSTLPKMGPGRADNGNFVLTDLKLTAAPKDQPDAKRPITLINPSATYEQKDHGIAAVLDGDPNRSGWAVDAVPVETRRTHVATFELAEPLTLEGAARLTFTLTQKYGGRHTLGRFRLHVGRLPESVPSVADSSPAARVAALRAGHRAAQQAAWESSLARQAAEWRVLKPAEFASEKNCTMTRLEDDSILVTGDRPTRDVYTVTYETDLTDITAIRLEALTDPRLPFRGPGRGSAVSDGNFMLTELEATAQPIGGGEPVKLTFTRATADYYGHFGGSPHKPEFAIDNNMDSGWSVAGAIGRDHWAVFQFKQPVGFKGGTRITLRFVQAFIDQHTLGRFRISATRKPGAVALPVPPEIESILAMPAEWRNTRQRELLDRHYLGVAPQLASLHARAETLRARIPRVTTTLVLEERVTHPRVTHIHLRGEWNQLGSAVEPGVPAILPQLPADQPADRLALARWIMSPDNPLTARVAVNRMWQEVFGRGLVETSEDFGIRAAPPSHPELLDWLATEYMRQKWSTKTMYRLLVTSAAYRQRSHVTPELLERDPYNVLLTRGPRFRIPAESVRDVALRAAGLLSEKMGGPSVFPPIPDGVLNLAYGGFNWKTSTGENRYRRGIYTFWKRGTTFPMVITFDAPSREACVVKRVKSNTPLQALTLMNDEVFVEAAQAMARRILAAPMADERERVIYAFRLATSRRPTDAEVDRILALLARARERIANGQADPQAIAVLDSKTTPSDGADIQQLAAWTIVANVLLNLDETVTKG